MKKEAKTKDWETREEWIMRMMRLAAAMFGATMGVLGVITSIYALLGKDWLNGVSAGLIGVVVLTFSVWGIKRNVR